MSLCLPKAIWQKIKYMLGRNINILNLWYMNYCQDIAILKLKWNKEKSLIKHKGQTLVEWISICSIPSISVWCVGTAGICGLWWWAWCTRSAWWTRASRTSLPSRSESNANTFCSVHVWVLATHISFGFHICVATVLLLHLQGIGAQMASGFDGKSGPQGMLSGSRVRGQQLSLPTSYKHHTSQNVSPLTWLGFF